jgi:hypothetical protein
MKKNTNKNYENETMKVKRVVQIIWKNIANGFQLVLYGIAKHKCIGHLQV